MFGNVAEWIYELDNIGYGNILGGCYCSSIHSVRLPASSWCGPDYNNKSKDVYAGLRVCRSVL